MTPEPNVKPTMNLRQLLALLLLSGFLTGCSSFPEWELAEANNDVQVFLKDTPDSAIPRYRGVVDIDASVSEVMTFLTNFNRYPEWVYQCESVEIIEFVSYSEAYLYQVTALPIISDRDIILHSNIVTSDETPDIVIELTSTPNFCVDKTSETCIALNNTPYVRVENSVGTMRLTPLANKRVRVTWEQTVDPAGLVPHWLVRLMLTDVPMKSLQQLKLLVESSN